MDKKNIIVSATLTLLIGGCANMNYRQQAALKGAAAGSLHRGRHRRRRRCPDGE